MRYDQVDHALTFLEHPNDQIVLQVPFHVHIAQVRRYIVDNFAPIVERVWQNRIDFIHDTRVILESITDHTGIGYNCPRFLIERLDGMLPKDVECA